MRSGEAERAKFVRRRRTVQTKACREFFTAIGIQRMGLDRVNPGRALPDDFNVVIEIPMNADPIKYEVDKESGAIFVDRFIGTAMHYPCNYGYVPRTLSDDGDPIDVLVITPFALQHGLVVRCRPLGVLDMQDEGGVDQTLLAV